VRKCESNNSADTKVSEEGGGGGALDAGAESLPLQLVMKTMMRQVVPLQSMEVHGGADTHLQPMEGTPRRSRWMPEGGCDPVGSLHCSRLLPGPADLWREEPCWSRFAGRTCDLYGGCMLEQPVPEGLHPVGRTHAGAVCEELQPVGRTHIGEICGELSTVRGTFTLEQGKSVRSPSPEEEGAAETTCDELTITPIPRPPALLGGRRERNRSEVEPGKKRGVGERCFKIWFYFSLCYSDLIGHNLNSVFSPSSICFVHGDKW